MADDTRKPDVDPRRECSAFFVDFTKDEYFGADYTEPGGACKFPPTEPGADHLAFACPGCGRYGAIRVTSPKQKNSWDLAEGTLDDVTTLTLKPSIHCVGCCGWHGFLVKGRFQMTPPS